MLGNVFAWMPGLPFGRWRLEGWDTFAGHSYAIPGRYLTKAHALRAGRWKLRELERFQPTATSGGQDGIQDRVYIVASDGARTLVTL